MFWRRQGIIAESQSVHRAIVELLDPASPSSFRFILKRRRPGKPPSEAAKLRAEIRDARIAMDVAHRLARNVYRASKQAEAAHVIEMRAAEDRNRVIAAVAKYHGVSEGIVRAACRKRRARDQASPKKHSQ